MEQESFLRS